MNHQFEILATPEGWLATPGEGRTLLKLRPRKTVYAQGDPAGAVFYIQHGKIKLTVVSTSGKEAVLSILGKGEFFGQNCLVGQMQRTFTASALTECTLVRLEKAVAIDMIKEYPAFAAQVMTFLLNRSIRMQEDLIDQLFNSRKASRACAFAACEFWRRRPSGIGNSTY